MKLHRAASRKPSAVGRLAPPVNPKSDIEPQSTQRIGGYGANSGLHPTLRSPWPLWLILSRFLGVKHLLDSVPRYSIMLCGIRTRGRDGDEISLRPRYTKGRFCEQETSIHQLRLRP
jgi:hypothetical protein